MDKEFDWSAAACGAIYGVLLGVFAIGAAGAGHGTYLPFGVFGAPLSLFPLPWAFAGFLMWPLGGLVLAGTSRRFWPVIFLATHAAAVVMTLLWGNPAESVDQQWGYLTRTLRDSGLWISIGFAIYLAGQLTAWSVVLRRRRSQPA